MVRPRHFQRHRWRIERRCIQQRLFSQPHRQPAKLGDAHAHWHKIPNKRLVFYQFPSLNDPPILRQRNQVQASGQATQVEFGRGIFHQNRLPFAALHFPEGDRKDRPYDGQIAG